jgi:hypothetical protein
MDEMPTTHPEPASSELYKSDNDSMSTAIPFRYGSFWDVPRSILLRHRGKALLLESHFDEALDEYPNDYTVYELPTSTEWSEEPLGPWIPDETPRSLIGRIPVTAIVFDETKRRTLDPECLEPLLSKPPPLWT